MVKCINSAIINAEHKPSRACNEAILLDLKDIAAIKRRIYQPIGKY